MCVYKNSSTASPSTHQLFLVGASTLSLPASSTYLTEQLQGSFKCCHWCSQGGTTCHDGGQALDSLNGVHIGPVTACVHTHQASISRHDSWHRFLHRQKLFGNEYVGLFQALSLGASHRLSLYCLFPLHADSKITLEPDVAPMYLLGIFKGCLYSPEENNTFSFT